MLLLFASYSMGIKRKVFAVLVGPQDDVAATDIEPADHWLVIVGTYRGDLPVELERVVDGAVNGHDRADRQDRVHRVVGQADSDRFGGIGEPLPVCQDMTVRPRGSRTELAISWRG